MSLDANIKSVFVINKKGKVVESKSVENIINPSTSNERKIKLLPAQRILQISMLQESDEYLGELRQSITIRDSLLEIIHPLRNGVLLVFAKPYTDIDTLTQKISDMVDPMQLNLENTSL